MSSSSKRGCSDTKSFESLPERPYPQDFDGFWQIRRLVVNAQAFGGWFVLALPPFYEILDPIVGKPASRTPIDEDWAFTRAGSLEAYNVA